MSNERVIRGGMVVDGTVDRFIAERELREKRLTLLDSEAVAALETRRATREQVCEWAKTLTLGGTWARDVEGAE